MRLVIVQRLKIGDIHTIDAFRLFVLGTILFEHQVSDVVLHAAMTLSIVEPSLMHMRKFILLVL